MAVEAVASTRTLRVPFVLALPVQAALAAVVAVSFVARSLLALLHVTPYYLPDEYLYPALARSLATTGHPLVRPSPLTPTRGQPSIDGILRDRIHPPSTCAYIDSFSSPLSR